MHRDTNNSEHTNDIIGMLVCVILAMFVQYGTRQKYKTKIIPICHDLKILNADNTKSSFHNDAV